MTELERVRRERDFYRSLLELDAQDEIEPLLAKALELIIATSGARLGYITLGEAPREWSMARGADDGEVEVVRDVISRGIIAESLASGELIQTPSALLDPRFSARGSVREQQIEAVLCAPIGAQPLGVVYLQGNGGGGPFDAADLALIERFARHLASVADRLLSKAAAAAAIDPTRPWRERLDVERLVGCSEAVARLLRQIHQASLVDIDVILDGPTGSGKTLVAELIAANGPRAGKPFVALNCAAIPETLVESELFGSESGAHSTATKSTLGKIAAADGGTLFFDEITELPLGAQAKLLQFLQSRSYYPLGSTRPRAADVRIIAASNVALLEAVEDKRFRADLMHRLSVFSVCVAPLSERVEDIPMLARAACEAATRRHGLGPLQLGAEALAALSVASWPGNIRQLVHTIEAAAVRAFGDGAATIRVAHLFPGRDQGEASSAQTWHDAMTRFQAEFLREALVERDWNVTQTARELDLARSHVYKLMQLLGIRR
jgi:Nif-specific regulatory protein